MNGQWTKEQAWAWYNARAWIRGCNFMSSDCCNRIDQWQEFGFEERLETTDRELAVAEEIGFNSVRLILEFAVWDQEHDSFMKRFDRYLEVCRKHGISAMIVLGNDCTVPKDMYVPPKLGPQKVDIGYHGGRIRTPHKSYGADAVRYHIMDDPDVRERYYEMVREIVTEYAHDDRVIVWNLFNEPGNGRGSESLPYMQKFFEICRTIGPDQPLCTDVWSGGLTNGRAKTEIQQYGLENSDIVSWHNYGSYESNVMMIDQLRLIGRPALNTEWLNRITFNRVEDLYPLFYLHKIGCYNWGFVAGKYQTYEPWESIWQRIEKDPSQLKNYDITKWQHDLIRPNLRPYDPNEIAIIKRFNQLADERHAAGNDPTSVS